jgi:hypothetical protein
MHGFWTVLGTTVLIVAFVDVFLAHRAAPTTANVPLIGALGGDWNRSTADLSVISNRRAQMQANGALSGQH